MFAQQEREVTRFLGIPVDGSKSEMIQKLKDKGFKTSSISEEILTGEFNGVEVNVHVAANNDKVWRIMVCDVNMWQSETSIRLRFNNLCQQFQNNEKYIWISASGFELPEEEDIDYEISVNDKRYEADYYQLPAHIDSTAVAEAIMPSLSKYTKEQLANPSIEVETEILTATWMYLYEISAKRPVWFMISKSLSGGYYISMFYDNKYNEADGEDL